MATSRARREDRRRAVVFATVGLGVVALAVLVGVLSTSEGGSVSLDEVAGAPGIEGEQLATAPEDPAGDGEVGAAAPVVHGEDFDGTPVVIGEAGTPQMVMFMASWCPACQEELPEVVEWMDEGRAPDGVEVVAVATSLDPTRPNWPPQDWFVEEGYQGSVLVDDRDSSVAQAYGLRATPYWVGIDADGNIAARVTGMLGADQLDSLAAVVTNGS
jgi:cytochrome c biogenesis protein CcmG, thiol:disulfide interchange protein DsbE